MAVHSLADKCSQEAFGSLHLSFNSCHLMGDRGVVTLENELADEYRDIHGNNQAPNILFHSIYRI